MDVVLWDSRLHHVLLAWSLTAAVVTGAMGDPSFDHELPLALAIVFVSPSRPNMSTFVSTPQIPG